jgi:hypothetical protein
MAIGKWAQFLALCGKQPALRSSEQQSNWLHSDLQQYFCVWYEVTHLTFHVYVRILSRIWVSLGLEFLLWLKMDGLCAYRIPLRNDLVARSRKANLSIYQVEIFWVVTPCSVVVGYQHFRSPCSFHLQVVMPCSVVVGYQRFRSPCCLHLQSRQKTSAWNVTAATARKLAWASSFFLPLPQIMWLLVVVVVPTWRQVSVLNMCRDYNTVYFELLLGRHFQTHKRGCLEKHVT